MRRTLITLCTALTLTLAGVGAAAPAQGASRGPAPGTPAPVAGGLSFPLSVAADTARPGSVLVTQDAGVTPDFISSLNRVTRQGTVATVHRGAAGAEVGGVSSRWGLTFFAETTGAGSGDPAAPSGLIKVVLPGGSVRTLADVATHEETTNPDGRVQYGFAGLPAGCAEQLPAEVGPATYTGQVDSHAYATELGFGEVYVADAGGNDVVAVNPLRGTVRTVAVLPAQSVAVTADVAAGLGLPACAVGSTYRFESVPTDVRVGPDHWLYVSVLPGGPEGPQLGARGAVYRINPWAGRWQRPQLVATGLVSPTGLAFGPRGDLYVAELFADRVSVLRAGALRGRTPATPVPVLTVNNPADVSISGRTLYVTANAVPDETTPPNTGQVLSVALRG
ncbi:hypothetical protein GCM10011512_29620 [Tersicoccus solisilvae]|uniref:ScyD/ScyE family protein n=1 Tax=Tersicoccus solisilvae TaxID=1882339 RepID=A0ABQ1PQ79_9MICC|nr:ScyD/ScyE family protein [Tersicoccus solisilvae]GGD00847.1 hypothetical protein GCM10011512_29620 [Tersicoccus solisilvae]